MLGLMGKKIGMTAIFDERGRKFRAQLSKLLGNIVVDKKTDERDGYTALVLLR